MGNPIKLTFDDVEVVKKKVQGRVLTFAQMFVQDMNNAIVVSTPVKLGFLRGSWFPGLNQIPSGRGSVDPSGSGTLSRLTAVALTLTLGDTYYLVNTAAYAARIEYGFFGKDKLGRNINQAGRGFIRGVVAQLDQIAKGTAQRVASGQYDV